MKTIGILDDYPPIPTSVAICPKCKMALIIDDIELWDVYTGRVTEWGLSIECSTILEFTDDGWQHWFDWHWENPGKDWVPLFSVVYKWFDESYRLEVKDE